MHSSLPACPDEHWKLLTSEIQSAGKELLGVTKKGKRIEKETWYWTKEVQSAVREKKQGLKRWKAERSEVTRAQYVTAKSEAKRAVSIAKAAASQKLGRKEHLSDCSIKSCCSGTSIENATG
ncbi:hypothetical protein PRIPAC_70789 [Pristionchus pacificus]|uniref:Uncharacterized protein n=1 Tax=Pristionchus pacificus TaxID=54126 RepID=A0A2A6BRR9_PRIPA|nr:hypothetical protein PRIPAC_70789 [Pristionchus pacificus]|eukprot:PDM68493.1 hypothetical protein PRIPAC_43995 [Pristionchus pacificus]